MSKQKQPRGVAGASVGMFGAESSPSRSAPIDLVISSALCGRAASHQAYADAATLTPVDRAESANKWVVLALSGTATFMTTLDSSIVNIGLPSIARAFGVPLSGNIEWVLIGYLVVIAAVLLTLGRLADMLGRKPLFLAGLTVFTLGSALCGAAPSLGTLVAARCFQGLGAAGILCVNVAMITRSFPAAERGRALGLNMILLALGVSAGPTIGGILTQALSWRWIFYVNLPIGALALLAAWRLLTERYHVERQRFDLAGAALLATGLAALTLGLSFGQEWGWASLRFLGSMGIAVTALAGAAWVEPRVPAPILDPALLRNRVFAFANISFMICMLALFAVSFLLPFYLEELQGFDTLRSGLLLTPLPLTLALVAPVSGALADRVGSRWLAPLGLAIACAGLLLLSGLTQASSIAYLVLCLIVTGIGQGLFQSPNARAIMGAAPPNELGVASGTLATGRVIGQSVSVAVAGAVFTSFGGAAAGAALAAGRGTLSLEQARALQETFVTGLRAAFIACALFAALGVVTALLRGAERGMIRPRGPVGRLHFLSWWPHSRFPLGHKSTIVDLDEMQSADF
jgi:EmrB/QacA subfamily drug resistance transporter